MNIFLFTFVVVFYLLGLTYVHKKFLNPINIIILWWSFWLCLSFSGFTDLFIPDDYVTFLVFLMLTGLFVGSVLSIRKVKNISESRCLQRNDLYIARVYRLFIKTYRYVFIVIIYYFLKAMYIILTEGVSGYRGMTFSDGDNEGILFGHSYIEIMYGLIVSPYVLFFLFFGVYLYMSKNIKFVFIISSLMIILESSMRLGRFGLYYVVIVLGIGFIISKYNYRTRYLKRKIIKISVIFLALIVVIGGVRENNTLNTFYKSVFEYHTVGFVLFNNQLINEDSKLNQNISYGRGTLGGIGYLSTLVIRRFEPDYNSYYSSIVGDHHLAVQTGVNKEGLPIYHNAFYTMLFPLYSDGRELTVFFIPLLFGFAISRSYQIYRKTLDAYHYMIILLIMFMFIFSLFLSMIGSHILFISFLYLYLSNKFIFFKNKNAKISKL